MSGTETPRMELKIKREAAGYYSADLEVRLALDGQSYIKTARAEIFKRDDLSGWSYTLCVPYGGTSARLSECDDIYERKSHIVEFLKSPRSRHWEFVTTGGLNVWALGGMQ